FDGIGCAGGSAAACVGAGFTCPRKTTAGRKGTSRTSRIVSGSGLGGGSGEFAVEVRGGMRVGYTGASLDADGADDAATLVRSGGSGRLSAPALHGGGGAAGVSGGAALGRSRFARGNSQEQAAASI